MCLAPSSGNLLVIQRQTRLHWLGMVTRVTMSNLLTSTRVRQEHERLLRNKDRRQAREKQKLGQGRGKKGSNLIIENGDAVSPSSTPLPSTEKPAGTTRKCANCGQAGHIKTNKKYCDTCLPSKSKNSVTFK